MTWRWLLWQSVLRVLAGLRVEGSPPPAGSIVVAHHSSHADTPALLAALGRRDVVVLAAADYWSGWRGWACRLLARGVPIPRTGGGTAALDPVVALLRAGTTVVVFPEGTREGGTPADPGRFRSGAIRLSEASGAPIVPVGLVGTSRLLPRHGRPRPAPVSVRFGAPLPLGTPSDGVREAVAALGQQPASWPGSGVRTRLRRVAASRQAVTLVALWALAEAVSWPVVPELAVAVLVVALPRRAPALAAAAVVGSLAGLVVTTALLRGAHVDPPQPLTTDRMRSHVELALAHGDAGSVVARQAWSGIPAKVYARATARDGAPLAETAAGWVQGRGLRMLEVGLVAALAGLALSAPGLIRLTGPVLAFALMDFGVGWMRVLHAWT